MKLLSKISFLIPIVLSVSSCIDLKIESRKYQPGFHIEISTNKVTKSNPVLEAKENEEKFININNPKIAMPGETCKNKFEKNKIYAINQLHEDSLKLLIISDKVGETIDSAEKAKYKLFPFWNSKDFLSAQFYQDSLGMIFIIGKFKDGSIKRTSVTIESLNEISINYFQEKPNFTYKKNKINLNEIIQNETTELHDSVKRLPFIYLFSLLFIPFAFLFTSVIPILIFGIFWLIGILASLIIHLKIGKLLKQHQEYFKGNKELKNKMNLEYKKSLTYLVVGLLIFVLLLFITDFGYILI